jgi:hypothetical protein
LEAEARLIDGNQNADPAQVAIADQPGPSDQRTIAQEQPNQGQADTDRVFLDSLLPPPVILPMRSKYSVLSSMILNKVN